MNFFKKLLLVFACDCCLLIICIFILHPIFTSSFVLFPYSIHPFNIASYATFWKYFKIFYIITFLITWFFIIYFIFSRFFENIFEKKSIANKPLIYAKPDGFSMLIGLDANSKQKIYIPEKSLYQNILITGTIGSGKTSSAMYPFCQQLISNYIEETGFHLGMLILDVKGNFYKQIKYYAKQHNRQKDLIVVGLNSNIRYNPLHKPNLKPSVLANRLRIILELFSTNNSESYWLDKSEQVISECIKLCRLYNNGYVTFLEIHKLINVKNYYLEKIEVLRSIFQSGKLSTEDIYNMYSSINFFETEFNSLDERVLSILKSEITRITSTFISDYNILKIFSPQKEEINFYGFEDVLKKGKIVVLNMNIAEYKNLSKIIAAYLKLDFQSEVIMQLSKSSTSYPSAFICDEYQEYVTQNDADFFAQSRESKCINIVSTQSYTSILNALKNESATKTIIQNLINKLWLRTDDLFTIESAQSQIGKEDKIKISQNISENAGETTFNYLTNSFNSKKSNISESFSTNIQTDFVFDTKIFTQDLSIFSCIAFLSDGTKILNPRKINLIPYFKGGTYE